MFGFFLLSCRYNLFLDVTDNGSIKLNFPDLEPDCMDESCALDVADRGVAPLEEVGYYMNTTRERVRQLETMFFARLHDDTVLHEHWNEPGVKVVRRRALHAVVSNDCDEDDGWDDFDDADISGELLALEASSTVDVRAFRADAGAVVRVYGDGCMSWDDELALAMVLRGAEGVRRA